MNPIHLHSHTPIQLDTTPDNPAEISKPSESRELIAPPDYVSVSGTIELLKLMLETSQADRKSMKEARKSAEKAQVAAENEQIAELREQADGKLHAALVGAAVQVGSAAVSLAGAGLAYKADIDAIDAKADNLGATQKANLEKLAAANGAGAKSLQSGAKGLEAGGGAIGGVLTRGAELHGVEATRAEQRANALARSAAELKSDIDDLKQHDGKMFDLVRQIEDSMNRCTQIALQTR